MKAHLSIRDQKSLRLDPDTPLETGPSSDRTLLLFRLLAAQAIGVLERVRVLILSHHTTREKEKARDELVCRRTSRVEERRTSHMSRATMHDSRTTEGASMLAAKAFRTGRTESSIIMSKRRPRQHSRSSPWGIDEARERARTDPLPR
jgi:hypothetical protein